jgi:predicted nucleic acid-binding protein
LLPIPADQVLMILDACTLINLVNGEVLAMVLGLPDDEFLVSPMVRDESSSIAQAVDHAVQSGRLGYVDDDIIPANEFARAKREMRLGNGETECILAAERLGCHIACDDHQARLRATERLHDADRVTGSIGLLRRLCGANLMTPEQVLAAYNLMRSRGGYLPALGLEDFAGNYA